MAGSQLKRLKSSLKDQGIVGPQKSKKQKKKAAEEARARSNGNEKRLRKAAALETIREQFNPFQFKMSARGPKFPVTSLRSQREGLRGIKGRPAEALSRSEEKRRNTLLIDMQRRNKVGGILDRRLGEGDPNMTPEERAMERFAFEKQRTHSKKGAVFDLEDDEDGLGLTHLGKSLAADDEGGDGGEDDGDGSLRDDFNEDDLSGGESDDDDDESGALKRLKRMRSEMQAAEAAKGDSGEPERKKSKKEVMEEVIAKSKLHKYERQAMAEADDDERVALDKMLPELQELLLAQPVAPKEKKPVKLVDASEAFKAATGAGQLADKVDKEALEKSYDRRLRELLQDKKAEPTARTKTEEELAAEQSAHLRQLEESRMKRMLGQIEPEENEEKADEKGDDDDGRLFSFPGQDDADEFQLGQGIRVRHTAAELGFDDEDDFLIDDDLVASGEDVDVDDDEDDGDSEDGSEEEAADEEDDEFTRGLLTEAEKSNPVFASGNDDDGIPYTFACPQTHEELLAAVRGIPTAKLPTIVQRIRALHHPKLEQGNKERLGRFAAALVAHVAYLGERVDDAKEDVTYATIESLVRHIHSLAKMAPIDVAVAFRTHLASMAPLALGAGDLVVLTAVAAVFPTSDHFHPVVTPAMLAMARFLEQHIPRTLADHATGLYVCTLFLQYQKLSRRYVPELLNFALNTVLALVPASLPTADRQRLERLLPIHASLSSSSTVSESTRKLRLSDCHGAPSAADEPVLRASLLATAVTILTTVTTTLWAEQAALEETIVPVAVVLRFASSASQLPTGIRRDMRRALASVEAAAAAARLARRPLELHNHRPMAIRTYVPRFEDEYDPDKHYDPNRERAETAKLQAEYKRERKGALRELRKDAAFMQREKLKLKKARDAAYDKKYKRLVAEIQGEEGRAANEYERERQKRKKR